MDVFLAILGVFMFIAVIAIYWLAVPFLLMIALNALGYSFGLLACIAFWIIFVLIIKYVKFLIS